MTSQPDPVTPTAANLKSYMRATGWHEGGQLTFGSIWAKDGTEFAVPHEDHDRAWLREVVGRLSAAEGRGADETAAAVLARQDGAGASLILSDGECGRLRALIAGHGAEVNAEGAVAESPAPVPAEPATAIVAAAGAVTDETVTAALLADVEWARAGRELVWQTLSAERARNLLEAAAPLIVAAERERAEATLADVLGVQDRFRKDLEAVAAHLPAIFEALSLAGGIHEGEGQFGAARKALDGVWPF